MNAIITTTKSLFIIQNVKYNFNKFARIYKINRHT